jgi:hypothetical protein
MQHDIFKGLLKQGLALYLEPVRVEIDEQTKISHDLAVKPDQTTSYKVVSLASRSQPTESQCPVQTV